MTDDDTHMPCACTALLIALCLPVPGAVFAADQPTYQAPKVMQAPSIDGDLSDDAWDQAPVLSDFVVNRTHEPAKYRTEVRLIYDEDSLYVALAAFESDLAGLNIGQDPDNPWWDDCAELFIDPQATRVRYFQFLINAGGNTVTSYSGDFAADIPCEAATGRTADAWTLELEIPFAAFGARPHLGERWGLNVSRARNEKSAGEEREVSLWSPTDGMHGAPGRFGYLIFAPAPGGDQPLESPDLKVCDRILDRIRAELHGRWRWTDADAGFEARTKRAQRLIALSSLLARFPAKRVVPFVRPAIRDEHVRPWTVPAGDEVERGIELTACRGEFESASLGLFATRDLQDVQVTIDELTNADGARLPAETADLHHVICWYQGGVGTIHRSRKTLLAELLMKDPTLVTIDPKSRTNRLHFEPPPTDASSLQPIDIPSFESRQVWITVRIPDDAKAGTYRGQFMVRDTEGECARVPLAVRVPAWNLAPSPMLHGLYYGRRMPGLETVAQEDAFFEVLEQELRDQIEHGCNVVATYVHTTSLPSDPSPCASAQRIHEIQMRYGVKGTPYFSVVDHVGFQQGAEQLAAVTKRARRLSEWARRNGRASFCFQGRDEASGEALRSQRPSWEACRAGGGKMWVACRPSYFKHMGDILDFPVVTGQLEPELADKVHANGFRILSYGNPQAGVEMPALYRRNYGLALRAAGYDGSINYEYRTIDVAKSWDDFDADNYRDHNFAYPAKGRPIDTIQFEGWREAVDDVRYAATLERAIESALAAGCHQQRAEASRRWLDSVTGYEDLDAVRTEMIRRIEGLQTSPAR